MFRIFRKKPEKEIKKQAPLREIENPGHGDCLFYAVAIALIPLLRKELEKANYNANALDEESILAKLLMHINEYANDITAIEFIEGIKRYEFNYKEKAVSSFLGNCNRILRDFLVQNRFNQLNEILKLESNTLEREKEIEGETIYADAWCVYRKSSGSATDHDVQHNDMLEAGLDQLKAKQCLENKSKDEQRELFTAFIFGSDVARTLILNGKIPPSIKEISSESLVADVLIRKLEKGHWGGNHDAVVLAGLLNVEVEFFEVGKKILGTGDISQSGKPIIRLNNVYRGTHWNTLQDQFNKAEIDKVTLDKIKPYMQCAQNQTLTLEEISRVFLKDDTLWMFLKFDTLWNRRHANFTKHIAKLSAVSGNTVEGLMYHLIANAPEHKATDPLRNRLNYLCLRFTGDTYVEALKNIFNEDIQQDRRTLSH